MAEACGDQLVEYLEGGDLGPFGGADPWRLIDAGVDGLKAYSHNGALRKQDWGRLVVFLSRF